MPSIRQSIAPVTALLMGVALLLTGSGLQSTFLPVRGTLEHFSYLDLGILGALYYVGFTAGCFFAPLVISRAGHIRAYLALISAASAIIMIQALFVEPVTWWILRALTGFCFSVLYIIIESWLNERSDNESRGSIFSIYMVINLTVVMFGQLLFTLFDPAAFTQFAIIAILISLAGIPVAMTSSQSPRPIPFIKPDLKRLYVISPAGFIGVMAHGIVSGAFWSLGPVFALQGGFSNADVGYFMSATVLGGVIGQWPMGRLSDRLDRRYIIAANCALAAIAGVILSVFRQNSADIIIALGFVYGVFAFPVYALVVAHANDKSEPTDYVETSSGLLLLFGIGSVIGPILTSLADSYISQRSLFSFTAIIHILTACIVVLRIRTNSAVDQEEKVDFRDALVATRTYSPLDIIEEPSAEDGKKTAHEERSANEKRRTG